MPQNLLTYFSRFVPLTDEAQAAISSAFVRQTYRRGDYLLQAGDVANHLYFIQTGVLRVYTTVEATDCTLFLGLDGEMVVALSSFIQRTPSADSIRCLEDTELYAVHYDRLQGLYDQFAAIDRVGRLLIERYAIQLRDHSFSLRFHSTEQRYDTLQRTRPELFQRVSLTHIASFLGMTAQAISMVRAKRR
ncbi:Crp/Fnr family transcriptional regulator [Fibrella aquatilis]|uniref:Cyclic nucleotide-binding domain-containing protein n=1 Tax=Fibrella aquatilis TaxID=2817059 RepID=A0A939G2G5_9BACT|nr:cyclic nucleotide-binding domain-containing protein [Fibrella aquatilis]MBO0930844.1 cyclic nucleotide-binding domain-containing protein [Fibrella aquatilis]